VVVSLSVALAAVGVMGLSWNDRADDICREQAPPTASDYSITWEWDEFAYICDYRVPSEPPRRIGVIDAFHGGGSQRHRPDR
jgi:hypothetical protein